MQYNVSASRLGLIQDCENLLGMSTNDIAGDSTLLKDFTRNINARYRDVNFLIWEVTGVWEYDDSNWTDLPIATTTLVDAQQDYEIPSTAQKIDRIEVKDSGGNYQLITPIDKSQIRTQAMSEFRETAGMPEFYDLIGRSLLLYPKPSSGRVTTSAGLKVYFSRDIDEFASTDTTASPGFAKGFHRLLSLGASLDYCIGYMSDEVNKINVIRANFNFLVKRLKNFYATRHRDQKARFSPKRRSYK